VNVGRGEEQADCGNRVSMTLPTIPARPMDPERLRILCQETDRIKLDEVQTMDRLGLRWTGSLPMDDNTSTTEAAQYFRDAMEVARRQHARSWELRATMSLGRLLAKQGRRNEGCAILSDVYGWFTEGFDTADLKEAKALFGTIATLTRPTATIPNAFRLFSCHLPN
jgi:hypothetical protein